MDNIGAFFGEDIFLAMGSVLLIQATLAASHIVVAHFQARVVDGRKISGECLLQHEFTQTLEQKSTPGSDSSRQNFLQPVFFQQGVKLFENRVYTLAIVNKTVACLELGALVKKIKVYYGSTPSLDGVIFTFLNTDLQDVERTIRNGDFGALPGRTDTNQGQICNLIYFKDTSDY